MNKSKTKNSLVDKNFIFIEILLHANTVSAVNKMGKKYLTMELPLKREKTDNRQDE